MIRMAFSHLITASALLCTNIAERRRTAHCKVLQPPFEGVKVEREDVAGSARRVCRRSPGPGRNSRKGYQRRLRAAFFLCTEHGTSSGKTSRHEARADSGVAPQRD